MEKMAEGWGGVTHVCKGCAHHVYVRRIHSTILHVIWFIMMYLCMYVRACMCHDIHVTISHDMYIYTYKVSVHVRACIHICVYIYDV